MSGRHTDNDGSDIFWPGYVDAVTNLVLNLLFLLTIMTVAVFMFALELGRASKNPPPEPAVASAKKDVNVSPPADSDLKKENVALRKEVERLKMELAVQGSTENRKLPQIIDVSAPLAKPVTGVEKTIASDFEVIVRFADEAVTFSQEEHDRLTDALQPIVANGKANIYVQVPAGFSEAKRMAFYRAMAVRNLLIEMAIATENINVSVVEGNRSANASVVRVQ